MFYIDAQEIILKDVVILGGESKGEIVGLIGSSQYAKGYKELDWSYLESGLLVLFEDYGLLYYEEVPNDLKLVGRAEV